MGHSEAMGRTGSAKLTPALVAREVGLVPGTLVQRFGSKRGLLLALAEYTARNAAALYERVQVQHATSPLEALTALVVEARGTLSTPETCASHLAYLCSDLGDPEFRALALTLQQTRERATLSLLDHAVAAGELHAGTDTAALAMTVQAASGGTALLWAVDQQDTLADRQRTALDAVLAPHRATV
ncbi:TetR family transcriptional regulator [Streptomyces roseoverticillatus]|uniref:TetR/AcrR family transcriptional regulator n=1 Tax=Streptomyces roseoverticillatus TaxID=66429 RepID=UPI001F21BCBD|nr:TetR/AcrR family transcriptional regulator [Streptomyces roseoverticillatus]MCF3103159.1 TetR family transcriptional regulator [Streptomyces roseoverticillatus]